MGTVKKFEDLEVWTKASKVAIKVLELTSSEKFKNDWGIRDQLRRATFSISISKTVSIK